MKKYLAITALLGALVIWGWYAANYQGFYIRTNRSGPVTAHSFARGRDIYVRQHDGAIRPFTVKGVVITGGLPGFAPVDFRPDESDYLRWLNYAGELGANTIRVYTVMDEDFYNALYTYNSGNTAPLYLLQSIRVTDYMNNSAGDAFDMAFAEHLIRNARDAVDVIHGNRIMSKSSNGGGGTYRKDVSSWVLGFIVGQEWHSATIAYTNNRGHQTDYRGEYISTGEGATAFEAMLAYVMDELVGYESSKYNAQRIVSFINDPQHDPFAYDQEYGKQIAKFSQLDAQRLISMPAFEAGMFAAYRTYTFLPDFWAYLSPDQTASLGEIPARIDRKLYYNGYTQLLAQYHTIPVVVVDFSFSSSRGIDSLEHGGPLTQEKQGEMLVRAYEDMLTSGTAGAVISGLMDSWGQRTWNTSYATDLSNANMWHDVQTTAQMNGLVAFVPGNAVSVDGDTTEWRGLEPLFRHGGLALYAQFDEEWLYLAVLGDVSPEKTLFFLLDTTPKSGGYIVGDTGVQANRGVDFLVQLNEDKGRLMVHERYEARRANFYYETTRKDAYADPPPLDSGIFVPVYSALRPLGIPPETPEGMEPPPQLGLYETGMLARGNGNPDSVFYNSLADYQYGPGGVELRLPWGMINFMDPSRMTIHDDYYTHYGVKPLAISQIHIGMSLGDKQAVFGTMQLNGWEEVRTRELKKKGFYVVQRAWGNAE